MLSVPQVVEDLRRWLGARLVAYLGGAEETRTVRQWAEGERAPSPATANRLRVALEVATLVGARDGPATVQAWFQGLNPLLEDHSPARLLRHGPIEDVGPQVLAAARAFGAGG